MGREKSADRRLARWDNLPDPSEAEAPRGRRVALFLMESTWTKILSKHIVPGQQPWEKLFGPQLVEALRTVDGQDASERKSIQELALDAIGRQIRQALEVPLVLLYTQCHNRARRWILVLPCGIEAAVNPAYKKVCTCFWRLTKNRRRPDWREAVRLLIAKHTPFDPVLRRHRLPETSYKAHIDDCGKFKEARTNLRFVALEKWGFCCVDGAWISIGCPFQWGESRGPPRHPQRRRSFRHRRSGGGQDG